MLKELVARFAILVFCLFVILSGVWVFVFGEQMREAGVSGTEVFSFLVRDLIFIGVVILVLVVVAVLGSLIFTDAIGLRLSELVNKLEEKGRIFEEEKKHILEDDQSGIYEEKSKLIYVFSYIREGVILLDRGKGVVLLNKAAEEIVGKSQVDVGGKGVGEVFKLFEGEREIRPDEYLRDDVILKKHLRLESVTSTTKFIDFTCVRLALIKRQDLGYMIVLHDLGEEVKKSREVGLLSAFASELRWGGGSLQLSVLRDNLLTAGLLGSGKNVNVSIGDVDLRALVNELVSLSSSLAQERQISFEVDIKDDLVAMVKGDELRIRQVVLNLFINAIKYTKSGGKVVVSLSAPDGELILAVQDTGIGIKTEDVSHLFEKFFVGENVPEEDRGLGLGLYVSKGLVDLMDGKIWVDSVEGRGTVASVSFKRSL